jgi:chromosome segregation ATPase
MTIQFLSLLLDFSVLAALGGAIYYTMRLTASLDRFKAHREELRAMIQELTRNIDEAQRAIEKLKKGSNVAADNLEGVMHDARKMGEELKLINETSDGLASRLEKLAEKNRKIAETLSPAHYSSYDDPDYPAQSYRPSSAASVEAPAFSILDRDAGTEPESWEEDGESFASQAEKDLYEALQRNKHRTEGRR